LRRQSRRSDGRCGVSFRDVAFAVPARTRFDPVDHLLALDPGRRGIAGFFVPGGALGAARALVGARSVLICTGFVVAEGMAESDGPPGAAVLGRALRRLGARVRYTSDPAVLPVLEATLRVLDEPADVFAYPEGPSAAREVLEREQPTHLVAIERPGRGREGDYLNARGVSVAAWNRPLDEMFIWSGARQPGSRRGWPVPGARGSARPVNPRRRGPRPVTIAVGDGGNEIGMGCVRARLAREGALMARIASMVAVDHLVVAGVSNWGAYGIVAQLGRLAGQRLLHTPSDERKLIDACVKAGAVDGLTRRSEPTVDALDADTHAAVVALLGLSWSDRSSPGERV
jgi:D-glutamate cyclase